MKVSFPYRLKSARVQAGLSMRQLSEQLGGLVSYNAIKKYEDGKMLPEAPVLLALAETLKVNLEYFSRPIKVEIGPVEFRRKASLGVRQIEQIKEKTRDLLERYLEVEELSNSTSSFDNPVKDQLIQEEEEVEKVAQTLQKTWNLGFNPIPNVLEMLEEKAVKVLEIEAPEKFDGLSTFVDEVPVAVINKGFPVERKRFTSLHELGHLVLNIQDDAKKEAFCNRFAGAMLISKDELFRIMGRKRRVVPAFGELIAIKEEFGISIQAVMRRALDLEIINPTTYKEFCRFIAKNRKEEDLGSFRGEEKSQRFLQLIFRLASEKMIPMNRAAQLAGLPLSNFRDLYYQSKEDENEWINRAESTAFADAYGDDEPDYDFSDIVEINPDYDPR